jgi:hypothetical protein
VFFSITFPTKLVPFFLNLLKKNVAIYVVFIFSYKFLIYKVHFAHCLESLQSVESAYWNLGEIMSPWQWIGVKN